MGRPVADHDADGHADGAQLLGHHGGGIDHPLEVGARRHDDLLALVASVGQQLLCARDVLDVVELLASISVVRTAHPHQPRVQRVIVLVGDRHDLVDIERDLHRSAHLEFVERRLGRIDIDHVLHRRLDRDQHHVLVLLQRRLRRRRNRFGDLDLAGLERRHHRARLGDEADHDAIDQRRLAAAVAVGAGQPGIDEKVGDTGLLLFALGGTDPAVLVRLGGTVLGRIDRHRHDLLAEVLEEQRLRLAEADHDRVGIRRLDRAGDRQ